MMTPGLQRHLDESYEFMRVFPLFAPFIIIGEGSVATAMHIRNVAVKIGDGDILGAAKSHYVFMGSATYAIISSGIATQLFLDATGVNGDVENILNALDRDANANGRKAGPAVVEVAIFLLPLARARGPVTSQHYSHSPTGIHLHQEAQAFRAAHPYGANPGLNFATADVTVDGANRTVRFVNNSGGMHSEQRLVGWHEAMVRRGRDVHVIAVYSERPPCGPWSANCADTLGNRFGQFLEVWHGDR